MKKESGFTILELVIVLLIIGILSVLVTSALGPVRQSNRDNKRAADIAEIQTALQMYYRDQNAYPLAAPPAGEPLLGGSTTYLLDWPSNPAPRTDGNCPDLDYTYTPIDTGASYSVAFCLGSTTGNIGPNTSYAVPGQIVTCLPNCVLSCGGGLDGCGGTCSNIISCAAGYTCTSYHCIKD